MSMRVSLIIDGDHKGARAAVAATESDLKKLGTAAADTQGKLNNLKPPKQPVQDFRNEVKLTEQQLAQMQFQVNDMVVGFASGQSPFTIMTQQGMQMSQMFRSGTGVMGALRAVGGGIAQFVSNPLNLVVVGAGVAATAITSVASAIMDNWPSANSLIEKHQDLVKSIGESWDNNLKRVKDYATETRNTMLLDAMRQSSGLEEGKRDAQRNLLDRFNAPYMLDDIRLKNQLSQVDDETRSKFESLKLLLRFGGADIVKFNDELARMAIATNDDDIIKFAAMVKAASDEAATAQRAYEQNNDLVRGLRGENELLNKALGQTETATGKLTARLGELSNGMAFAAAQQGIGGVAGGQPSQLGKDRAAFADTGSALGLAAAPQELRAIIIEAALKNKVDPDLLARLIYQESRFNPNAVSPKGAKGLTQLMPGTASDLGVRDPFNPIASIHGGAAYLGQMQKMFAGNSELALMGYNWGAGNVQKWQRKGADPEMVPKETRDYVGNILGNSSLGKFDRKEDAAAIKESEAAQKRLNSANERWSQLLREGQTQLAARSEALGKSVYEQARLTREEQLWTQARATFGDRVDQDRKLFAKLTEEITKQADAYGDLAVRKMQDEKFAAGREKMEGEQIQRWNQIRSVGGDIVNTLIQSREAGQSWGASLNSVLDSVKKKGLDLLDTVLNQLLFGQQGTNNGGALGPLTGGIANVLGGLMQSLPFANGSAFNTPSFNGPALAFASGAGFSNSVVTRPTWFGFGGGKLGLMAEEKPEAVMPLTNGMEVRARGAGGDTSLPLTRMADGSLGVDMRGGAQRFALGGVFGSGGSSANGSSGATTASGVPRVNLTIHNYSGEPVTERRRQNADGSIDIEAFVGEAVNKHIAGGRADGPIGARFGMRPKGNTNV